LLPHVVADDALLPLLLLLLLLLSVCPGQVVMSKESRKTPRDMIQRERSTTGGSRGEECRGLGVREEQTHSA
jgi:hypothetical protein